MLRGDQTHMVARLGDQFTSIEDRSSYQKSLREMAPMPVQNALTSTPTGSVSKSRNSTVDDGGGKSQHRSCNRSFQFQQGTVQLDYFVNKIQMVWVGFLSYLADRFTVHLLHDSDQPQWTGFASSFEISIPKLRKSNACNFPRCSDVGLYRLHLVSIRKYIS